VRDSLKTAVKDTIILECHLPCSASGIGSSCLSISSPQADSCFSHTSNTKLSHIIYNGIVEFAINQYKIDYNALDLEQRQTIARRIKYSSTGTQTEKLKHGFYGEVLLDLILRCHLNTDVLIARGYFYSVLEDSEPKGFDVFHLLERNNELELWFGEAKFHATYRTAIKQVLEKIHTSLSDGYVSKNLIALIDWDDKISTPNSHLSNLLSAWEANPDINLATEMKIRNISLVYPVFIAYEKTDKMNYHNNIKSCIDYIEEQTKKLNITIPATFDYRISFIFLPVDEVKKVKETVIEWIENQEPLMP